MSEQLLGQETEYAIRFSPAEGYDHPGNAVIFKAISDAVQKFVKTKPGERYFFQEQFFIENGGAFCYEHLPYAPQGGLLEGATPECANANEFLLYQRAQEKLLNNCLPVAEDYLEKLGFSGNLGLIKNCRDAEGHVYGAQENYQAILGSGLSLWIFRFCCCLCLPMVIVMVALYWGLLFTLLTVILLLSGIIFIAFIPISIIFSLTASLTSLISQSSGHKNHHSHLRDRIVGMFDQGNIEKFAAKLEYLIFFPMWTSVLFPFSLSAKLLAFRKQTKILLPFIISRCIVSGAGSLLDNGTFALSEKALAIKRLKRMTISPDDRPIFDTGNLHKQIMLGAMTFFLGRLTSFFHLLSAKGRLQLGLSDSNRCDVAEYLKIGSTSLVIKACEAGYLQDAPTLKNPLQALRSINLDPSLQIKVETLDGRQLSALDLQYFYLQRIETYLKDTPHLDYLHIIDLWKSTLKHLQNDPSKLIGRIDWITKRYLLEVAGEGLAPASQKKIDIAYHELGKGYFDTLARKGLVAEIVTPHEIDKALTEPASPPRVKLRSQMIKSLSYEGERVRVSWNSVRIGQFWQSKVIHLNNSKKTISDKNL